LSSLERPLRSIVTAILVASALAIPASAKSGNGSATSTVDASRSSIRIENFGSINKSYFRGAQPEGRDYRDLAALGVKMVLDLQKDGVAEEAALVEAAGMKFLRIPMTTHVAPTPEQVALFLKHVSDPADQPVYVHCAGGRHRTGVMTAVYRMTIDGWSAERAFAEMKKYKFGADFLHAEFKEFVYGFHPARDSGPLAETAPR
jgi:tyrosine-protein phosphatase SIW14